MSKSSNLEIECPCCKAELTIDAESGTVLLHKKAKEPLAGGKDFDTLLAGLDEEKDRAEALFEREKKALEDKDRILEEKFKAAMKRAEEEDGESPPPRPFDLD